MGQGPRPIGIVNGFTMLQNYSQYSLIGWASKHPSAKLVFQNDPEDSGRSQNFLSADDESEPTVEDA